MRGLDVVFQAGDVEEGSGRGIIFRDAVPDRLNKRIRGRFELADQSADPDRDTLRGIAGRKRHADYADPFGDRALRKREPLFARLAHPLKDVAKIHALPTGVEARVGPLHDAFNLGIEAGDGERR